MKTVKRQLGKMSVRIISAPGKRMLLANPGFLVGMGTVSPGAQSALILSCGYTADGAFHYDGQFLLYRCHTSMKL